MRASLPAGLSVLLVAGTAMAQTIQLPSFSAVGVNTTVVVPDSGGAYISRVPRYYQNFSTFGRLPRHRGWSVRRQAPGFGVTAQIHDPAVDDAGLRRSFAADASSPAGGGSLRIGAGRAAGGAPTGSVAQLKRRRARQLASQADAERREAVALLEKGRRAQADGNASLAAVYYRMAARRATGPLRDQIVAQFNTLPGDPPASTRTGRSD